LKRKLEQVLLKAVKDHRERCKGVIRPLIHR
jgi:hypothetical protein